MFKGKNDKLAIQCQWCDKNYSQKSSLSRHTSKEHPSQLQRKREKHSLSYLETSVQSLNNLPLSKDSSSLYIEKRKLYQCKICKKLFSHRSTRSRHIRNNHPESSNCKITRADESLVRENETLKSNILILNSIISDLEIKLSETQAQLDELEKFKYIVEKRVCGDESLRLIGEDRFKEAIKYKLLNVSQERKKLYERIWFEFKKTYKEINVENGNKFIQEYKDIKHSTRKKYKEILEECLKIYFNKSFIKLIKVKGDMVKPKFVFDDNLIIEFLEFIRHKVVINLLDKTTFVICVGLASYGVRAKEFCRIEVKCIVL